MSESPFYRPIKSFATSPCPAVIAGVGCGLEVAHSGAHVPYGMSPADVKLEPCDICGCKLHDGTFRNHPWSTSVTALRLEYEERKAVMLTYLDLKRRELDMHAIEDAASDIRDIEAALGALRKLVQMTEKA